MNASEELYRLEVMHSASRTVVVGNITGSRETVLDVALRVMMDAAPRWDDPRHRGHRPTFEVTLERFPRV